MGGKRCLGRAGGLAVTQTPPPGFSESSETVVYDEDGTPVLALGSEKMTVFGPQGEPSEHSRDSGIRLPDGFIWTREMLNWANPILLTTCSICRKPPFSLFRRHRASTGLVTVRNARSCARCGATVCGTHRRWTDEGWHCLSCAKKWSLMNFVRPIFFREED